MTPLTLPTQTTLESRVTVGPGVPVWTYSDYWGTYVSVFDLHRTARRPADPRGLDGGDRAVRGRPGRRRPARLARAPRSTPGAAGCSSSCCRPPLTTVTEEISDAAIAEIAAGRTSPDEAAAAISARVREHVTYLPGATGVRTNAQEAWDKGQGVCQDMAQIAVALLRAAGLPARYVSGYLHPDPKAQPGSTSVGQSHAWVEYWAGSWTALDPTSGAPVGERHVVVARGRDYADVPPLKGIYHGPPESDMQVTVEVTRLA